jgi:hypothetical protein
MTAKYEHAAVSRMRAAFGPIAKFLGWWAGLFGFITAGGGSVCPCCGTTGCPVAPVAAGVLGGIVAVLLFLPRWLIRLLRRKPHEAAVTTGVQEKPE